MASRIGNGKSSWNGPVAHISYSCLVHTNIHRTCVIPGAAWRKDDPAESEKERARRAVVGGWMDCTTLAEAAVAVWIVRQ